MDESKKLLDELSELEKLIEDVQSLLKDQPDDEVTNFQLKQLRSRQRKLLAELEILKSRD